MVDTPTTSHSEEHQSLETALRLVSGKWKCLIIRVLLESGTPLRSKDLDERMPNTSQRVLTSQLRELEAHGLLTRRVFAESPPRVEYSLTPLGRTIEPVLAELTAFGIRYQAWQIAQPS